MQAGEIGEGGERSGELASKIILVCKPNLPVFLTGMLQAKGLTLPGQLVQRPELVPGRPGSQESGASRGVRCPSGSLLQVGGQGQRILGFNLPPVISMTWQPELGSRVKWSPTGLMIRGKWEQMQRGWGRDEGVGRDRQGLLWKELAEICVCK